MKKGSIVIATLANGYQFVTDILKTDADTETAVVSCYYHEDEVDVIPTSAKLMLGITEDWDVAVLPLGNLKEIITPEKAQEAGIAEDGFVLAMPGFSIDFKKTEHLSLFEEFANKYYPVFEVMMSKKQTALYVNDFMKVVPTELDKRMLAVKFKDALNLSYVPYVENEKVEVNMPEICALNVEFVKYIKL